MSATIQPSLSVTGTTAQQQKPKLSDREFIEQRITRAREVRDVRPAKSGMHVKGQIVRSVEAFRWKLLGTIDVVNHGVCLVTQDRKTQRRAALMIDVEIDKAHWVEVTPERPEPPVEAVVAPVAPYTNEELAAAVVRYYQLKQYAQENRDAEGEYTFEEQARALRAEFLVEWGVDLDQYEVDLQGYQQAGIDAEDVADAGGAYEQPSPAPFVHLRAA